MRIYATKSELQILNVLWNAGAPLTRSEILERSEGEKTWKDNSIHILLNGMLKKGLVEEAGFTRSGKVWGRLYGAAVTPEEQYRDLFLSPVLDPVTVFGILLERQDTDTRTLDKLQDALAAARARQENGSARPDV